MHSPWVVSFLVVYLILIFKPLVKERQFFDESIYGLRTSDEKDSEESPDEQKADEPIVVDIAPEESITRVDESPHSHY